MKTTKKKFGMFTKTGNLKVAKIVDRSDTYEEALERLKVLELESGFMEASDTEVREEVYLVFHPEEEIGYEA